MNVNEDYAGIYDYRGSQDGRFRRKRTLTTNVEQFLTRSSRIRAKRMAVENAYEENAAAAVSPAEQAENLVSLLSVMQDSDPEFDATEFLKVSWTGLTRSKTFFPEFGVIYSQLPSPRFSTRRR